MSKFSKRNDRRPRYGGTAPWKKHRAGKGTASGAVAAQMIEKNPQINAEYKLLLKDSPCFIGIAKGEDPLKSKVNEIIANAKKDGTLDAMAKKWLGRPAGDLPV